MLMQQHHNYLQQLRFKATSSATSIDCQDIATELYFAIFTAEHNLPSLASDNITKFCKFMFLDSDIAKRYLSGYTKSTVDGTYKRSIR